MSELDLDAIRARCAAATPGPWTAPSQYPWLVFQDADEYNVVSTNLAGKADLDAAFIAAAREDVPALLAALASSRAEVERLRPVADEMRKIRDLAFRFGFLGDRPEVVEFIYRIHTLAAAAVDTYESQGATDG